MSDYSKIVEHFEGTGQYESLAMGEFEAITHLARVTVVGPADETIWERTVRDRNISFAIPLPFFYKRLGHLATRADTLINKLNTE